MSGVYIHLLCSATISFSANASPNITVDAVFKVTVNTVNILKVAVFDQDGDTVSVTLLSDLPGGASFKDKTYTWTPTSMDPVNIS